MKTTLLRRLLHIASAFLAIGAPMAQAQADADYPITIQHALGTTVIEARPERVAAVSWANHEVPLALGVVPVGFARANFGDDDDDGLLPWVADKLDALGGEPPVLFDEGDGIDFEAVAATRPDVILAAYSGLTQADYDTLSQIAPVIAYPQAPWATEWRDMIRLNSKAIGMAAQGDDLIGRLETEIAAATAAYPQLAGKSAMFVTHINPLDLSTINFYTANDTRVKFFDDLGLASPKSVREASTGGSFSGSISAERVDLFDDVDIVVTYGDPGAIEQVKVNALIGTLPAVRTGAIVGLRRDPLGTAANPTPLSISWVLEDYVRLLAEAAAKAE
ncbi:iron-siderophore ABC transporter substrate-binding protein [Aureimonas altamirensis]|uniref:iron-siderophore ABC transporter substrate-binding protein n=1 Tax=Aureimonas altamirensis TaxID=370622 RepID=UPI0020375C34|nr:iron-siderophore ABC transporter substrate-binding protein [Aureimonas altamirensis]MCM2502105.1 iron-siderophore ABC transporter substrate-binding protein [Aureimonas altamirensis]